MLKQTTTAPLAKNSSKVQRHNYARFLAKRNILISPLAFARLHGGQFRMQCKNGTYFVGFESADKKTHAWGSSFTRAYRNFLKMFNQKYKA